MRIPQIQIQQTYAKIGIESSPAKQEIEQPKAEINIHQEPIKVEIQHKDAKVLIDQTKAWSALGKRPSLELMKVIYGKTHQVVMDTIAKIAQKGDRMAAIHIKADPIPNMAAENAIHFTELYFEEEPSVMNISFQFVPGELNIQWSGGRTDIDVKPNKPIIRYFPGDVNIYIRQKENISITPPEIEIKI